MKFDVIGVGNALVDETYYVNKDFVDSTDLFFNQFKSISFEEQEKILSKLPEGSLPDVVCGGSTTNSLAATSNLGSNCAHICQLGADERGKLYEENLQLNEITSLNDFYHTEVRTGRCLVFITPNSERTMGTYLGASERLIVNPKFIEFANQSKILFSEGYQFTSDENYGAFLEILKGTNESTKLALSLSDPGVVQGFRSRFEEVFSHRVVDYLFCNREEATALAGENYLEIIQKIAKNFVVTNGADSSEVSEGGEVSIIKAHSVKAIDSNGAGDIFAGAALHKIIEEESFYEACKFGNYASSVIVQEKSPRLSIESYKNLLNGYNKV
ncbi:MAG: adenosine kinase [Gammaproteobacteria bacterium]|nr:adenosine kinase [Gammaproteobacteria bacterium]